MWELICHHTYKYKGVPVDLTNYNNDGDYPVATMVEVAKLGLPGLLLETEAIAMIGCS